MKKVIMLTYIIIIFVFCTKNVFAYNFVNNLTIGSSGNDVIELQNILIQEGFLVLPSNTNKGFFGNLTKKALMDFQIKHNISPAFGYFGPTTRMSMNNIPQAACDSCGLAPAKQVNVIDQNIYFGKEITEKSDDSPIITDVSASQAKIKDTITVRGDNFGSKVNVYTSIGIIKNKKVSNNSISFSFSEILGKKSNFSGMPISFSIGNDNGVSSNYGYIVLE